MNYILLGAAGFLLMHLLDFASMKKLPLVKPALSLSGTALIVFAAAMAAIEGEQFGLPAWASAAGWVLFIVSMYLTIHSLYFALPLGKTYVTPGASGQLVTSGVYRLVRHPWLLFFAAAMIGLTLGSRSILALEAGIAWTALSAILVSLQDRKIFPRMFAGYGEYQQITPMLLPNRNSVTAFIEGLKRNNKVPEV
jgi:protein-S-isoprenylcysteine O-methyltransferase Ste14